MIYKLFRFWANIAIRVFYGKIEVSGIENIPKNGPLLIASNHPNGFLEPIIIGCVFSRPLHFMVRGDVFQKAWLKPLLIRTNQIPIFRFKDGFSELRKNDSSLRVAYDALDKGAAIILFIEGGTINIKKLRPFQKGLARMASEYLDREETSESLNILPVAINFVSPFVLRSRVALNIGKPIPAPAYFEQEVDKVSAIKKLTAQLYQKVKPLAFHVSADHKQATLNATLRAYEGFFKLPFFPMVSYTSYYWPKLKAVTDAINKMDDDTFTKFEKEIKPFSEKSANLVQRNVDNSIFNYLSCICLAPLAFFGYLANITPGLLAKFTAKKVLDEDNMVFRASIILCSGVGFYLLFYALVLLVLCLSLGWIGLVFLMAWPMGFLYLFWKNLYSSTFAKSQYSLGDLQKQNLLTIFTKYNIPHP